MTKHQITCAVSLFVACLWALGVQISYLPMAANASVTSTVKIERSGGGQFVTEAFVEGAPVNFVVDTGATMVALTARDARRAGFPPESLEYDRVAVTPAGATAVAVVRVNRLQVGDMELRDIDAAVTRAEDGPSLLGLNALAALERVEIRGDTLTLGR